MRVVIKRIFQVILVVLLLLIILLGGIIAVAIVTDYEPEDEISLRPLLGNEDLPLEPGGHYSMITFNIGYAALGKDQTFFMDGGTGSGAESLEEVEKNLAAMTEYIHSYQPDFVALQEVDQKAKRSYQVNQVEAFLTPEYTSSYATNYRVTYVPVPFTSPMGGVESGLVTLSKTRPSSVVRYAFDGKEPALQQLFDLDRCFTISRFPTENGKELVLINAHFSAFDQGGRIRQLQLQQMQQVLIAEQTKGNYILLAADFNHELPGTDAYDYTWEGDYPFWAQRLPEEFAPLGFHWAVDVEQPTVRAVDFPYVPGKSFVCSLDGFLLSDNLRVVSVQSRMDFAFEHSDHNPVELVFELKKELD